MYNTGAVITKGIFSLYTALSFYLLTFLSKGVPMLLPVYTAKMAATGVLPFVRGVDFTKNDFKVCWKKIPVMKNDSPLSFVRWVPCRSQIVPGLFNFDTTTPCPCVIDPINRHTLKVEIEAIRITYFGSTGLQCLLFSFFYQSW